MATYALEVEGSFDLPQERVFALFADHKRLGQLLGAPMKRIRDSDQADPNGLGSVRKIGIGPLALEETVTYFELDTLIEYSITSISPVRNHFGRIRFGQANGKTQVYYSIQFDEVVPFTGKLVKNALEQAIQKGMKRVPKLA
jgi:hypothetical protein